MAAEAPKRKPGWMSVPGGPKEPNRNDFRAKFQALVDEKTKCFDGLKEVRDTFDAARGEAAAHADDDNSERKMLKARLDQIAKERKEQRDSRRGKSEELREIREQRRKIEQQLKDLSSDLGAFRELDEIEAAIEHLLFRMETGKGDLKSEKVCIKRLNQLEEAKSLILQLNPLSNAIADAEEREAELQTETRDIHARIEQLNADFEKQMDKKMAADKKEAAKKPTIDRAALQKKRDDLRTKIEELNKKIDDLRTGFDEQMEAWNKWRVEAMAIYKKQQDEERKERERQWKEREEARALERRRQRAAKKLNPYANEIDTCASLIRYLEDKIKSNQRDKEAAERKKKLAAFDPAALAPGGMTIREEEDDWLYGDRTGKNKQKKPTPKPAPKAAATEEKKEKAKDKYVQHSAEKYAAFGVVKLDVPVMHSQIAPTLEALRAKKKEYESHIKTIDEVSDDGTDEEEKAAEAAGDDATAVASTAAVDA